MPIPDTVPPPEFVGLDASDTSGLDLLGLRLPVQTIGNSLLDGITTATPTVRYLSLRTWLLYRYIRAEPPPPDRNSSFRRYAQPAEAAFALANLLRNRSTGGLIGPVKGARKLDEKGELLEMEKLTEQPAVRIYAGPSDQLRLTGGRDPEVPRISTERGEPLALAVDESFEKTSIGRRLHKAEPLGLVAREELEEFGQVAWVDEIPDRERRELIRTVIPEDPAADERPRVATYALLLALAERSAGAFDESRVFDEAIRPERVVPASLADTVDGWLLYAVRDSLAVTAEASLAAVVRKLHELDPDGAGVRDTVVVRRLLEDAAGEQMNALRELGLGDGTENLDTLSAGELLARVRDATPASVQNRGLLRWPGDLNEPTLYRGAGGARDGALMFGLVSWLLAERRAGVAVRDDVPEAGLLSHQGTARFGLRQVILPRLADWQARELSVAAALSELTHLVIDQHLRIAWARLAQHPKLDVSIFRRDGDRLVTRIDYQGGRTASRLARAIGWLHQLGLLHDHQITAEGRTVLERVLRVLAL